MNTKHLIEESEGIQNTSIPKSVQKPEVAEKVTLTATDLKNIANSGKGGKAVIGVCIAAFLIIILRMFNIIPLWLFGIIVVIVFGYTGFQYYKMHLNDEEKMD
jgi:hypothetical protein